MGGCGDLLDLSAVFELSSRAARHRLSGAAGELDRDEECSEGDDDDDDDVELPDRDGDVDDAV